RYRWMWLLGLLEEAIHSLVCPSGDRLHSADAGDQVPLTLQRSGRELHWPLRRAGPSGQLPASDSVRPSSRGSLRPELHRVSAHLFHGSIALYMGASLVRCLPADFYTPLSAAVWTHHPFTRVVQRRRFPPVDLSPDCSSGDHPTDDARPLARPSQPRPGLGELRLLQHVPPRGLCAGALCGPGANGAPGTRSDARDRLGGNFGVAARCSEGVLVPDSDPRVYCNRRMVFRAGLPRVGVRLVVIYHADAALPDRVCIPGLPTASVGDRRSRLSLGSATARTLD